MVYGWCTLLGTGRVVMYPGGVPPWVHATMPCTQGVHPPYPTPRHTARRTERASGLHGLAGRAEYGNTREYTGIHGNTGKVPRIREYTGIHGNTRNTAVIREYTGIHGNTRELEYNKARRAVFEYNKARRAVFEYNKARRAVFGRVLPV